MSVLWKYWTSYWRPITHYRLIVLGLDGAGKTTMIYKLAAPQSTGSLLSAQAAEVVTTIPTIGFNVETVEIANTSLTCWDVGGCDKIRPLWRHFTKDANALVFVVDSSDHERIEAALDELVLFLTDETLVSVPLLVFANKQDLHRAYSLPKLVEELKLPGVTDRKWAVFPSVMSVGLGVREGFQWLRAVLLGGIVKSTNASVTSDSFFECAQLPDRNGPTVSASNSRLLKQSSSELFNNFVIPGPSDPTMNLSKLQQESQMTAARWANINRRDSVLRTWKLRCDEETLPPFSQDPSAAEPALSSSHFLLLVSTYQLPSWDHYVHIRLGYELFCKLGINGDGFKAIDESIHAYILHSSQTNGKTFNRTMTHFWAHMIAYVMQLTLVKKFKAEAPDANQSISFAEFLRQLESMFPLYDSPDDISFDHLDLTDGKLFQQYYSTALIFGAQAKIELVLPDMKSLPLLT
jgi:small GTP-binding protein